MRTEEIYTENYKTVYYYDDYERNVRTADYNENGEIVWDIHYDHNKQNQCDGWRVFNSKGDIIYRFEVDFDELGREKEVRQFDNQDNLEMRTVSSYDEAGFLISEIQYDEIGKEIESESF